MVIPIVLHKLKGIEEAALLKAGKTLWDGPIEGSDSKLEMAILLTDNDEKQMGAGSCNL